MAAALELVPEAWIADIVADATAEGAIVAFTAASSGLRTDVIDRIDAARTARDGDPAWESLTDGQRLDELFPTYNGIGAFDLLNELGVTPVYVLTID